MLNPSNSTSPRSTNTIQHETSYLYVSTSQLMNAGAGLFTRKDISKDEVIAVFYGEVLDEAQIDARLMHNLDRYFVELIDGRIMDTMHTHSFAKYANDAQGFSKSTFRNNAKIMYDDYHRVCLIASRNIKSGEEIFCSYGRAYWKKHALN